MIEDKIKALEEAVRKEDRNEILAIVAPNMEGDIDFKKLSKEAQDRWNKLEEKGIKIIEKW